MFNKAILLELYTNQVSHT